MFNFIYFFSQNAASITPKPVLGLQNQRQPQQQFQSRTRSYLNDPDLSSGFDATGNDNTNDKYYRNPQIYKKTNEYVTSHESSIKSKNRFQTTAYNAKPTLTTTTTTADPITTITSKRPTRFNPYRSITTPKSTSTKTTIRSTTPTTTTTVSEPPIQLTRSHPEQFISRSNHLQRQPLFSQNENQELLDNFQQPFINKSNKNETTAVPIKKTIKKLPIDDVLDFDSENYNESKFSDDASDVEIDDELDEDEEDDLPDDNVKGNRDEKFDLDDYFYDNTKSGKGETNEEQRLDESSLVNPAGYLNQNKDMVVEGNKTIETSSVTPQEVPDKDEPVILHSNFYLPEAPVESEKTIEDNDDDSNEEADDYQSHAEEHLQATTHKSVDYDYEYEEYDDESTSIPLLTTPTSIKESIEKEPNVMVEIKSEPKDPNNVTDEIVGQAVVSVVTTKSVKNGSSVNPNLKLNESIANDHQNGEIDENDEIGETDDVQNVRDEKEMADSIESNNANSSTESWVVVASVQTSRSVSGARFLPFPQVEQEEKKQALSELDMKVSEEDEDDGFERTSDEKTTVIADIPSATTELDAEDIETTTTSLKDSIEHLAMSTTEHLATISHSTESIIDKLDRVQSELSSGLLSGKFPILNKMTDEDSTEIATTSPTTTVPTKTPAVVIRRFTPRTTTNKPDAKVAFDALPMDDLSGLLPFGFKPRNTSYRNKKITTTTTTTSAPSVNKTIKPEVRQRNANISRSFKNNPISQDINSSVGLKTNVNNESNSAPLLTDILAKIKFEENLEKLLPKDYKPKAKAGPATDVTDDISRFLPKGYTVPMDETTKNPKAAAFIPVADDLSKFLPPGYKPEPGAEKSLPDVIPIADDVISKLLPPGYKLPSTTVTKRPELQKIHKFSDNGLSKFLPPGFKVTNENTSSDSVLNKIKFKDDVSALLPPGFKTPLNQTSDEKSPAPVAPPSTKTLNGGLKVVFPKSLIKRPGVRTTTARPAHSEGPSQPEIVIRKGGPPVR